MIRAIFVCLLAALTLTEPAWAGPLPALTGPVVLTVTGLDPTRYPQGKAEFDMAMLDALDAAKVSTSSIWTEGVHSYTGPSLNAVTTYLSIANGTLSLHALNDYAVKMPASEVKPDFPILATRMDGQLMPVRDKGPIWVIFPYDADVRYRSDTVYSRSIWQLDRIDVLR